MPSPAVQPISDKDIRRLVYGEMPAPKFAPPPDPKDPFGGDEELAASCSEQETYTPIEFEDAIELLYFIDDNFRDGRKKLHPWQIEELQRLCKSGEYTIEHPLRYLLVAANGSGKDAFVIALFCIWKLVSKVRSRTIVTSASYTQLKNQTENYIKLYANRLNQKLSETNIHEKACIVKKEHVGCFITGSEIVMFVTDDPGRAEGFHPFPDYSHNIGLKESIIVNGKKVYPGGDLTIIENEAKTVPDEINEAIGRCTYNRLLKISSPGHTGGHFYRDSKLRETREYPAPYSPDGLYLRRVTSYDCPHIPRSKIEYDREYYGENSPIFRSKHLALFTSVGEQVVIMRESLQSCLDFDVKRIDLGLGRHAGIDTAAGGDENTLYVFDENIYIGHESFTIENTTITAEYLVDMFRKWELKETGIHADDGGVSHGITDNIWNIHKWHINRVLNQSPAIIKLHYGNRGAELYFNFARLIQERLVNLKGIPAKAIDQLSSRYYKQQDTNGKLILESKKEARLNGHGSPDHADGIVLAWSGVTIDLFRGKEVSRNAGKSVEVEDPVAAIMRERDKMFEELRNRAQKKTGLFSKSNIGSLYRSVFK